MEVEADDFPEKDSPGRTKGPGVLVGCEELCQGPEKRHFESWDANLKD